MIFVKTKSRAKYLYQELSGDKLRVGASHSDLSATEVHKLLYSFSTPFLCILCVCILTFNIFIQRDEVVTKFRTGEIWFLIATDLMARGMDFKNVGCVINYDFPPSRSSYIHRIGVLLILTFIFNINFLSFWLIGRTGRAGKTGTAITFYSDKDTVLLKAIANVIRSSGGSVPDWMFSLDRRREYAFFF